jgi:glycosyltransferase involved in cell wall biosynthesis
MKPFLSIVIANYNYGRFLETAIRSVVEQDGFDQCELIVVDGGSTDNSVEIIKKYEDKISWWVSEKDKGQSDAFNKGFSRATGKILTWLNADDVFFAGALRKIVDSIEKNPTCEWFTGNMVRFLQTGEVVEIGWGPHVYPTIFQRRNSPVVAFGPSTFFSRRIFQLAGGVDERLHYVMDPALWKKFMKLGIKQCRLNFFCWGFRMHEVSKTAEYKGHARSAATAEVAHRETRMVDSELDYKVSSFIKYIMYAIRIIDGSLIYKFWASITLRYFDVEKGCLR